MYVWMKKLSLSLSHTHTHTPLKIQQFLPLFLGAQSLDVFLPALLHLKELLRLYYGSLNALF
jgi:hypothetical protein